MSDIKAVPLTSGPKHHFFGYYDKFQVNATGTKMLTMEVDFMDRPPAAPDAARIGVIDLAAGNRLEIVAETHAWCWQQSCMLQWFPGDAARKIIFNVRRDDHFGCCILDIESGEKRFFERPIYTVSSDGRFAMCPNFARLADTRPGYGYEGIADPWADENAPEDDGIYHLDLETGDSRLVYSLAQAAELDPLPEAKGAKHWFNHLLLSPDDHRVCFMHRRNWANTKWHTRLLTMNVDGSEVYCVNDHELNSHFIWRDPETLLTWARRHDRGDHYYYLTDRAQRARPLAPDKLTRDGHMSYHPRGDWIVTDTYPWKDEPFRRLILYNERTDEYVELGRFHSPTNLVAVECRCDLHPRWSRDGRLVTFDSLHEGSRQVYAVDVSGIVGR